MWEPPFQLWQSSRAPLEPPAPGGALASGLGVLWGCGEDAAGCGRDTHTSAGASAGPPLPLPGNGLDAGREQEPGSPRRAPRPGLPLGPGSSPGDGGEGDSAVPSHPAGSGPCPSSFPLLRLPSRHMARRPRPGSGSERQTATAGLPLPARQEGTRRAGWLLRAPACAPAVSPRSRALPEPSRRSGAAAGISGFGQPASLPPPAAGRKGQQWEAGGELSCPVTGPRGQGGHGLTQSGRGGGGRTGCEDEASQRLDLPVPCARFVPGRGLPPGTAGWHRESGLGSRDSHLPGRVSLLLLLSCLRCGPSGSCGSRKTPQTQAQRWVLGRGEGSEGQPRRLGRLETPGDGPAAFPNCSSAAGGICWLGGETRYPALRLGGRGAGPTPSGPPQTRCRGAGPGLPPAADPLGSSVRHDRSPSGSSGLRSVPHSPGGGDPEPPSSPLTCLLGASSWIQHQIRTSRAINQPAARPCVVRPYGGSPNCC